MRPEGEGVLCMYILGFMYIFFVVAVVEKEQLLR